MAEDATPINEDDSITEPTEAPEASEPNDSQAAEGSEGQPAVEEFPSRSQEAESDGDAEGSTVKTGSPQTPQLVRASYSRGNAFVIPDNPDEADELNEHVRDPGDPDGIIAAEDRQRWEEAHPAPTPTPPATYKPKRLWPKILITIIVIAAATYGAYWIGNHEAAKGQNTAKKQQTTSTKHQSTQATTDQPVAYMSTNYSLSFNYLKSWTVSDTTTKLTITSPTMQLTTDTGSRNNVRVVVTIQNPVTTIPGFPAGGAVASLASQDLSYTQPTPVQPAQSYVSYLGYASTSGVDAMYVTGNFGYQQGQVVPMSDVVQGNPLISVTFETCSDSSCGTTKAATLNANAWQSSTANKDVTNLIESLEFQG